MILYSQREQTVPASLGQFWDFFSDPVNLTDIPLADMKFKIVAGVEQRILASQVTEFRVNVHPIGSYRFWYHKHFFETVEIGGKTIDKVRHAIPPGALGGLLHWLWIQLGFAVIFNFRCEKINPLFGEA